MTGIRSSSVNNLSDEVISLIIYQLNDPGPFSMTCKRFYDISRDPYVRASYFLARYGRLQAFYWALSRGKLLNERVIDILQTSGAHLSRYLIQIAIHHYFRTTAHFIKHQWTRTVPYHIFVHFMTFAKRYGSDVPLNKGEDDGTVFLTWLKERLTSGHGRKIEFEVIKDLFQKYDFMIFSPKDPLAMQLLLGFAMEPSLLPLATSNGFHLDFRYRDFIFRKMFEKSNRAGRINEIAQNVRQITQLDKRMFLSRTVAAEVCMECRSNEAGYAALKELESSNDLRFSLKDLVNDLLQLFLRTRSITNPDTIPTLQTLFRDFPSSYGSSKPRGPRQVMLITIFCTSLCSGVSFADHEPSVSSLASLGKVTCDILRYKLKNLGLLPVMPQDLLDVLVSPWCVKPAPILSWAEEEMEMTAEELQALAEEAAIRSLATDCKGKLIRRLAEMYATVVDKVATEVLTRYQIDLNSVPDHWTTECSSYHATLNTGLESRDRPFSIPSTQSIAEGDGPGTLVDELVDEEPFVDTFIARDNEAAAHELGAISQDTLSYHIQLDTENNLRAKRRHWPVRYPWQSGMHWQLKYPDDATTIGRWVFEIYGPKHPVTAVFMTHAIINRTEDVLVVYLNDALHYSHHVPITMKHFHIMAKLGRDLSWLIWHELEHVDFYMTEEDYIDSSDNQVASEIPVSMKMEQRTPELNSKERPSDNSNRKRPRRNTLSAPSYLVPDSDDEAIQEDGLFNYKDRIDRKGKGKAKAESHLQCWIKHLSILLKEEERKYKEKKKQTPKDESGKPISRCPKSDFMKSLAIHLRELRITERRNQRKDIIRKGKAADSDTVDSDCYGDGEFILRPQRNKKRRLEA